MAALIWSSLTLHGCASNSEVESIELEQTVKSKTLTNYNNPERKYTRYIETPWGLKSIYDPAKDPKVIEEFRQYRNEYPQVFEGFQSGQNRKLSGNRRSFYTQFTRNGFRRIVDLDLARIGCMAVIDNSCTGGSTNFFAKNCGTEHNFGNAELSQCEKDNYNIVLPRGGVLVTKCEMNSKQYDAYLYKTEPDLTKALEHFTEIQCYNWDETFE